MIKLSYTEPGKSVEINVDPQDLLLPEFLTLLELFIEACGYVVDGNLDIVEIEEE